MLQGLLSLILNVRRRHTGSMLIYCYEPLGRSFDAAVPALLRAVDNEQVRQALFGGEPDQPARPLGEIGGRLNLGAFIIGAISEEEDRIAMPIQFSTKDPSLISMVGEVTLSRLRPALCHLSLNSSITGRMATGLMYNRTFQMAVELTAAEFLSKLARAVLVFAPSDRATGWGAGSA